MSLVWQLLSNAVISNLSMIPTSLEKLILTSPVSWRQMQERILSADKELQLEHSNIHQSLKHLSTIHSELSWLKIWDMALDHGIQGTRNALCLFNTLSRPLFGNRLCPHCETSVLEDLTYLEHLICDHQELGLGPVEEMYSSLISASSDTVAIGKKLCHLNLPLN